MTATTTRLDDHVGGRPRGVRPPGRELTASGLPVPGLGDPRDEGDLTCEASPGEGDAATVVPSTEDVARQAALFKALADPVRLRVFLHISAASCSAVCACHLPELFGVSQPTLSHHLKKLTDAGLVHREMRGRWAHYTVRPETVAIARNVLAACC